MPFAPARTGERLGGAEAGIAAPETAWNYSRSQRRKASKTTLSGAGFSA